MALVIADTGIFFLKKGIDRIIGTKSKAKVYPTETGAKKAINQLSHMYPKHKKLFEIEYINKNKKQDAYGNCGKMGCVNPSDVPKAFCLQCGINPNY